MTIIMNDLWGALFGSDPFCCHEWISITPVPKQYVGSSLHRGGLMGWNWHYLGPNIGPWGHHFS